ncbi:GTPase [Anaeromyxobacter sp. Fw109-5]|uniref:GTPase n=1 Tax=Anaeromyxobacter sp. (strain Fw109-5) TaxID=404589 RepID=UPI0000ED7806|nr:GTPase [Anaeromyxobacter sp. Fw109-5]ABS24409.1 TGS domain protein [Anaeromyxobacter sp. Fw109-5]
MPANLTTQYKDAELRFRQATDHDAKREALREMLALLPKHKGTEKLHADLKKRLAKLEEEAGHAARGGHRADPGHVRREGAGQWILVGPPNAGKSSLLAALTHAHPEIGEYPFTTRAPLPGMAAVEDVQVQLVDTPPVAAGHTEPYLPNLVQGADGVIVVLDPTADDVAQAFAAVLEVLSRGHVWPRGRAPPQGASPLLVARPVLVVATRRDLDDGGTFAALARDAAGAELPFFAVSATRGDGLDALRPELFRALGRIRVYTKEPGKKPDLGKPFVLPAGATVHDLAALVHHDVAAHLKFARIWGHARFEGQQVDRHHVLADRDVVELHA